MPRKCTICGHSKRTAIDKALVERCAFRTIADRYGVSKTALIRHHDDHLPAALVKAQEAADVADANTILADVQTLRDRALTILDTAEEDGKLHTALAAVREVRGCLELLGRLAGKLQDQPTINLHISTEWLKIQAIVLTALEAHPEARVAVASALSNFGGGGAGRG